MKIFLSYASDDRDLVEAIAVRLQQEDHEVFFDAGSLEPGDGYDRRLRETIESSDLFIFFVTPSSVAPARYTITELGFARKRWSNPTGRIIPVMLRDTPLDDVPAVLRAVQMLIPRGNLAAEVAAAVDALSERRRAALVRRGMIGLATATVAVGLVWGATRFIDRHDDASGGGESGGSGGGQMESGTAEAAEGVQDPALQRCEAFPFAAEIWRAYNAFTAGDPARPAVPGGELQRALVTHAEVYGEETDQFLGNVTSAFTSVRPGGEVVRHTDDHALLDDWAGDEASDRILLRALFNSTGELRDGSSSVYLGPDDAVSVDFSLEGESWMKTRSVHQATFAYALALHAPNDSLRAIYFDKAVTAARNVCPPGSDR